MKKYFTYVPFWLSIIVNIILDGLALKPIFLALICIFGLFNEPSLQDQLIGCLILIGIFLVIILVNYIVYRICKEKLKKDLPTVDSEKVAVKIIIIIAIFVILGILFVFL